MPEPMAKAVATVRIDNERVRVTEWRFAPGAHTGHHRHDYAYVVVPLTTRTRPPGAARESPAPAPTGGGGGGGRPNKPWAPLFSPPRGADKGETTPTPP